MARAFNCGSRDGVRANVARRAGVRITAARPRHRTPCLPACLPPFVEAIFALRPSHHRAIQMLRELLFRRYHSDTSAHLRSFVRSSLSSSSSSSTNIPRHLSFSLSLAYVFAWPVGVYRQPRKRTDERGDAQDAATSAGIRARIIRFY